MEITTGRRKLLESMTRWLRYRGQEKQESEKRGPYDRITQELAQATYRNDPFGAFLVAKLKLSPVGFFLVGILVIACLQGLSFLLYALIPTLSASALSQYLFEWPMIVLYWVVFPSLLAFYPWVARSPGRLFVDLYLDGVAVKEEKGPPALLKVVHNSVIDHTSDKRWSYAAVGLTLASGIYWFTTGIVGGDWDKTQHIGSDIWLYHIIQIPMLVAGFYMLFLCVARIIEIIRGLFKFFGEEERGKDSIGTIIVRPWHPDKCGGLGKLNEYAIRFSYFIALLGLWLVLNAHSSISRFGIQKALTTDTGLWTGIIGYIVLAPTLFFLTLGSARRAMLRAKSEHLHRISEQLDAAYREASRVDESTKVDLAKSVEKVRLLNELYTLTSRFPVWPFDFATIRRFITAWIAPFLPLAASFIIPYVAGLFSS